MALVVQCALTDPSLLELSSVYENYKRRFGVGERYGRRQVRGVVAAVGSESVEPHAMTRSTALPKQVFGESTPIWRRVGDAGPRFAH
jgi:hypothetical protein